MAKNNTYHLPHHLQPETKPKSPDTKYLFQMIITVYFREKAMKLGAQQVEGNAIHIESVLNNLEIDYQNIHLATNETLHVHCNDPEEREHIKHILLKDQNVLCFENDSKRFYSIYTEEYEKDMFKWQIKKAKDKKKEMSIQ